MLVRPYLEIGPTRWISRRVPAQTKPRQPTIPPIGRRGHFYLWGWAIAVSQVLEIGKPPLFRIKRLFAAQLFKTMTNTKAKHGGARVGAGRPPAQPSFSAATGNDDPRAFLIAAMNDIALDMKLRLEAAKTLMPFVHRKHDEGKKTTQANAAQKVAAGGKFASGAPPLRAVR